MLPLNYLTRAVQETAVTYEPGPLMSHSSPAQQREHGSEEYHGSGRWISMARRPPGSQKNNFVEGAKTRPFTTFSSLIVKGRISC